MDNLFLLKKIESLPENLKVEVEHFVDFLKSKFQNEENKNKPHFGSAKGMFVMKPDFDESLDDFNEYMS